MNEDDKLMDEMESLKSSMDARARRDKKKKAKIKAKERQRAAIGLHGQDEEGATQTGRDGPLLVGEDQVQGWSRFGLEG